MSKNITLDYTKSQAQLKYTNIQFLARLGEGNRSNFKKEFKKAL